MNGEHNLRGAEADDLEARLARYTEIQQQVTERAPYTTLCSPKMTTMRRKNVGGLHLHAGLWLDPPTYRRK